MPDRRSVRSPRVLREEAARSPCSGVRGRRGLTRRRPSVEDRETYVQPVYAYRTTFGFDAVLGSLMRGAWKVAFHGDRGQVAHHGDPHCFVRAGQITTMWPCDARSNLTPAEVSALWARGEGVRASPWSPAQKTPSAAGPWWRIWG